MQQGIDIGPFQILSKIVPCVVFRLFPDLGLKVEHLDHPDTEKTFPDLFGEFGKSLLGCVVILMHPVAQIFCNQNQKRKGDQTQGRKLEACPDHDADAGTAEKQGVHQSDDAETKCIRT